MRRFCKVRYISAALAVGASLAAAGGSYAAPSRAAAAAPAVGAVSLSSEAKIERTEVTADGRERTILKNPGDVVVVPGDRVVFTLKYANRGPEAATGFRATNPMPGPVQFVAVAEDWAEVSVDGGSSWGKLATLNVAATGPDGVTVIRRPARPEDVTHVRWVFASAIAPGAEGSVSYRGVVK